MLRHGIGDNRRAVQHVVDLLARQIEASAQLADTGDRADHRHDAWRSVCRPLVLWLIWKVQE
jgi:hypothetical protein